MSEHGHDPPDLNIEKPKCEQMCRALYAHTKRHTHNFTYFAGDVLADLDSAIYPRLLTAWDLVAQAPLVVLGLLSHRVFPMMIWNAPDGSNRVFGMIIWNATDGLT